MSSGESRSKAVTAVEQRVLRAEADLADAVACRPRAVWLQPWHGGPQCRAFVLEGSGEPIVLLHGATLSGAWWLPVMAHLPGRPVVAVDFPGHGLSAGLPPQLDGARLRQVAVAVVAAAVRLTGASRAVLVGNSLGGMAAVWAALDIPDEVARLVVVGAPGVAFPGGRADPVLGALAVPWLARVLLAGRTVPSWYTRTLARSLDEPALMGFPALGRTAYWSSRRPEFRRTVPAILSTLLSFREPRPEMVLTRDELGRVTVPVLYLHGTRERFLPRSAAEAALEHVGDSEIAVLDGGHAPWLADPRGFAERIR